jgi:ankyrin repeat protein
MNFRQLPLAVVCAMLVGAPDASAQYDSPVIDATREGDHRALEALVGSGADLDDAQGDGATALHWAAHRNDLSAATLLIGGGAAVNVENDLGATPLWLAARSGSADMVVKLLQAGAETGVSLTMGETPLMAAARSGASAAVDALLRAGADPNATEIERGQTALMWAAAQSHATVVTQLIEGGADIHTESTVWHQLENTAGNTNPSGNFRMAHGGSTALLFAARNGDIETARALVAAGADVNDTSAAGTSALVIAAHSGHGPLAIFLLEAGADPNHADAGYTALHAAALRSQVELAASLVNEGANIDALVERGTPGRRFSGDFSLRHQYVGANALWLAARYGEPEILQLLLDAGANAFNVSGNGMTTVQAAIGMPGNTAEDRRNQVDAPQQMEPAVEQTMVIGLTTSLLDLGVDVNLPGGRGSTPLHDAVRRGFGDVVRHLVERGADINIPNGRDQTPLTLAESRQTIPGSNGAQTTRPEIAQLLRDLGATE